MFPRSGFGLGGLLGFGTLDPNSPSTDITLSNGNLTATQTVAATWRGRRTIGSVGRGKIYFEVTWGPFADSANVGIVTAASDMTTFWAGDGHSYYITEGGALRDKNNVAGVTLSPAPGRSGTASIALDCDAGLIWFRTAPSGNWNNDAAANPSTGAGGLSLGFSGPYYAAVDMFATTDTVTLNFGASAFAGAVPSGFVWG